jgi:hypothetical protein
VQSSKKKKKKSKAAVGLSDVLTPQAGGASASSAAGTPAGKRKAAKAADDGMDEVDRALAELKLQFPGLLGQRRQAGRRARTRAEVRVGSSSVSSASAREVDPS